MTSNHHHTSARSTVRPRRALLTLGLTAVLGGAIGVGGAVLGADGGSLPAAGPSTVLLHGDSRQPSTTAQDWVTYADHVVILRPTAERAVGLGEPDEGGLGMRSVTSDVLGVVWSSATAAQAAPATLDLLTVGTKTTAEGRQVKVAMEGAPRLELGHTYLAAVSLVPARCAPGDTPVPAHFEPLGEHAVIPFDGDVVGQGEVQGEVRSITQAKSAVASALPAERGIAAQVVGQGVSALTASLQQAVPTTRETFVPTVTCP